MAWIHGNDPYTMRIHKNDPWTEAAKLILTAPSNSHTRVRADGKVFFCKSVVRFFLLQMCGSLLSWSWNAFAVNCSIYWSWNVSNAAFAGLGTLQMLFWSSSASNAINHSICWSGSISKNCMLQRFRVLESFKDGTFHVLQCLKCCN